MAPIQACPTELHSYIAYLCCLVDRGSTIQSLGRVSRYFHQISRPFLHHSVLVTGTQNVLALDRTLQSPQNGGNIRHLYLAPSSAMDVAASHQLVQAVHRILVRCSPTLSTLTLDFTSSTRQTTPVFSRLFRTSFPQLQELTVSGYYPNPTTSGDHSYFPLLKRLHLHGNWNPYGLLRLGGLPDAFPQLTHLQISGIAMAVSFALDLEEALGVARTPGPRPRDTSDPFTLNEQIPQFPPHLSHLIIQAAPLSEDAEGGSLNTTATLKDAAMMERLETIASARKGDASRDGIHFDFRGRDAVSSKDLQLSWEVRRLRFG